MRKRTGIVVAMALVLSSVRMAWAETKGKKEDVIEMERIVVTASRAAEEIKNASKYTTIIDEEDIRESNAQTIPDILRAQAGIEIRDYTGTGKTVNVDMRGFGETGPSNMLVLIDGRRVNAIDLSNTDWSQISLSQVERIEIVRGASSVLYGDNASGGVINIITKKGKGRPAFKLETKGGSYNTFGTLVEVSAANDKSSAWASGEYYDTKGYRQNSNLLRDDFAMRLNHAFGQAWSSGLSFGYHTDNYRLPGALSEAQMLAFGRRATTKPDDLAQTEDYYTDLELKADFKEKGQLQTNVSFRNRDVDSQYFSSSWSNENHITTVGITPKYTIDASLANMPNTLIFGADLYFDEDNILDGMMGAANDKILITKHTQGIYLQDRIQATDRLSLKAGYRHEMAQYLFHQITQVDLKEKKNLTTDVYDIGIVYLLGDTTNFYCDYSSSFRFPLVDEFFTSNTWGSGGLNTGLKPQEGKDIEVGIRHKISRQANVTLNYFHHAITNEIYLNPMTYQNSNYDKTTHQGLEAQGEYAVNSQFKLTANYTYTDAVFGKGSFEGNTIPAVPMHKASGGFRWTPDQAFTLNFLVNYVGSMYLVSDQQNAYPKMADYVTVDLNASRRWKNMELFAGIDNIFDAEYSEYGVVSVFSSTRNFYPAPGRRFMAGCRLTF
ncbi:TonB-dependent receptor [Candidatus Velamenicoccus archaeovorus]|uniref:TonB-dependent receptor n=1 Tax=Velamenicoccus archaeovorus TaxID=1930593 RepID=A0A410P4L6_VELA1|nr:TonB-dependent receptor [Candidatus Velamenicoccus archaeovorus]QAT16924.1 TonB-dependent receptor [Candidatus Velamenicoccus archaeovorus]